MHFLYYHYLIQPLVRNVFLIITRLAVNDPSMVLPEGVEWTLKNRHIEK